MQNVSRFVKPGATALVIALAVGGSYEGTRLIAYHDPGNGTPTICMGETKGVFMGMTKTLAECNAIFSGSMGERVMWVKAHLRHPQPETRVAGLADFAYNEGYGTLLNSITWRSIQAGNIEMGCNAMLNYTRAGTKHLAGLKDRHQTDCELCMIGQKHSGKVCGESSAPTKGSK